MATTEIQLAPEHHTTELSLPTNESRYYTVNLNANYILPSDAAELERLKLQHEMLKRRTFTVELLPEGLKLHAGDCVLDSGTGAGHWVQDVSPVVPEGVMVYGCDVEGRLFPKNLPPNTSFSVASVLDLPPSWSSIFSLVHQRLLIAALGLPQWKQALSEIHRVLTPGGFVRLEEIGDLIQVPENDGAVSSDLRNTWRLKGILTKVFSARNLMLECALNIPDLLKDAGFEMLKKEKIVLKLGPGEDAKEARDNFIGAYRGMKGPALKLKGLGVLAFEEDYDKLMDDVEEEWKKYGVGLEFFGFTARKTQA